MSDETEFKKSRSPNYPRIPIGEAIEMARKLFTKARMAPISPETAIGPLGYTTMNGAALGAIAALSAYGLIDRIRGGTLCVSSLAVKIFHPTSKTQFRDAVQEAISKPAVFQEIISSGFSECSEDLLANHLMQNGFTPEGAKKVSAVFAANKSFSNSGSSDNIPDGSSVTVLQKPDVTPDLALQRTVATPALAVEPVRREPLATQPPTVRLGGENRMIAQYFVPLGANEATIAFYGESLSIEDFDALLEYVELFKKQFERKQKAGAGKGQSFAEKATALGLPTNFGG